MPDANIPVRMVNCAMETSSINRLPLAATVPVRVVNCAMEASRINRLSLAALYCLGWFPVAVFALYMKYYEIAARYSKLLFVNSQIENPGLNDYLFLYKSDVLFNFFVIPLFLVSLGYFFHRKGRWILGGAAVISLTVLVLLYANLHSWGTIGRFLTWTSAVDAAAFASQNTAYISMYIDHSSMVKFMILVLSVVALFSCVKLFARYTVLTRLAGITTGGVLLFALMISAVGHTSHMKDVPINSNFIYLAAISLFESYWDHENESRSWNGEDLQRAFSHLSNTRNMSGGEQYFGRAEDNDVIVFVLETGSSRFIDLQDDLESFPTLSRLAGNSLIGLNHHATFPATSESLFSVFNSIYPPRNYYSSCVMSGNVRLSRPFPGFLAKLGDLGYMTSLYLPYNDVVPLDHILHQNQGFSKIYFAQSEMIQGKDMDVQALDVMKADISSWLASDQRYVAVFLPQIGHAPWPQRPESVSITEYGKQRAIMQDEWLGQIVDVVEEAGRLDKTLILVTGDHGIRTTHEDPQLNAGFLDEYSFRVPLLLFSKSAFSQSVRIGALTSHVDISPSVLDLQGVERDRMLEQGLPLWDAGLKQRTAFFLANWYFGADGFYQDGIFKMYSEILDTAFSNHELRFNASNIVEDNGVKMSVRDVTRQIYAIQQGWLKQYICDSGVQ
jgi:phosphoglycerol transferase MdoB-like AlkP superfamily enzyme